MKKKIKTLITLAIAAMVTLLNQIATAEAVPEVNLGTAYNFGVLAGSTITSANSSVVTGGDVGLFPGTSITGPISITPPHGFQIDNGVAYQAKGDLFNAYSVAAGLSRTATLTGQDLGGMTLIPGVYFFATSAQLTGQLTLNNQGNPDAVFVFQIGSTLTTASDSKVVTINDGPRDTSHPGISVYWQVGSSATLGTGTDFEGNILAKESITDSGGSTVEGRLLTENAAVTLNNTTIDVPPAEVPTTGGGKVPDTGSTLLLFGSGLAIMLVFPRRLLRS
jgi:type VI secretion system secreted protein VgrG